MRDLRFAIAAFAPLAACGQGPAEAPAANRVSTAAPAPPLDPVRAAWREDKLRECGSLVLLQVPPGTDVERLCGCAIDRGMAGRTLEQLSHPIPGRARALLHQCAAEMGIPTIG
jgi:hypothetical protein